jgi:hypothetical protein
VQELLDDDGIPALLRVHAQKTVVEDATPGIALELRRTPGHPPVPRRPREEVDVVGARWIEGAALAAFAGYVGLVATGIETYALVVANYLPAAAFLLVVLLLAYRRTRARPSGG